MTRYDRIMCAIIVSFAALCWPVVIWKAVMWVIWLIGR